MLWIIIMNENIYDYNVNENIHNESILHMVYVQIQYIQYIIQYICITYMQVQCCTIFVMWHKCKHSCALTSGHCSSVCANGTLHGGIMQAAHIAEGWRDTLIMPYCRISWINDTMLLCITDSVSCIFIMVIYLLSLWCTQHGVINPTYPTVWHN